MDRTMLAGLTILAGMFLPALSLAGEPAYGGGAYSDCNACGHYGGFQAFWHRCGVDWHRNNAWPEPFLSADKMAVRAP